MRRTTYYVLQSAVAPDLRGIAGDPDGTGLPAEDGPWSGRFPQRSLGPWGSITLWWISDSWRTGFISGAGFPQHASSKPVIERDRVEGTSVYDPQGHRIGTIKRVLIEKVSGRVVYVDVTFGVFLGAGGTSSHHPVGEAHLRHKASWVPHRHHRAAGPGCSGLLRR
jgi:hypothetical protein